MRETPYGYADSVSGTTRMDYIKLACLKCGQGNRVPNDKMYQGPKCASCGAGLLSAIWRAFLPTSRFVAQASRLICETPLSRRDNQST